LKEALGVSVIIIRKIDNALKRKLSLRAAANQRSIEEEVHHILRVALSDSSAEESLADIVLSIFGRKMGIDIPVMPRTNVNPAVLGA
jgi:antitoxin FitA